MTIIEAVRVHETHAEVAGLALPHAVHILPVNAPRELWLAERRPGLGGSDISAVIGINPFKGAYEVWLDKTGRAPEKKPSRRMEMGNLLEPVVRKFYVEDSGNPVHACGLLANIERPWMRYTPDGVIPNLPGLFEAKTTNWRLKTDWSDGQVADHAELQVQWGMGVTGLELADVAVLIDGDPDQFKYETVKRDQELIDMLIDAGGRFWHDHVLADVAPPMTATALDVVKTMHQRVEVAKREAEDASRVETLLAAYKSGQELEKQGKTAKETAQAELINIIGDAEALTIDGQPRYTYKLTTRRGYTVADTTYRTIRITTPKEKK